MLEFQQDFFKPEIREGFFLDATMKTIWAAELEVLSQIAMVCERHGIQWYAAYGTLLGAIRHEGFIPWDDDIDIWVMRKDFEKLMTEYLPKELPSGYLVKSTLNDTGYDQFHACVVSGDGISMRPERLREFHGCPFLVALDIFPLDYLPRDENKRTLQSNLAQLAGSAANLAFKLEVGELDGEDRQETIQNIKDAQNFLEAQCAYRFQHNWLREENWKKVGCDLFNCVHFIVGQCEERDSDYIVEYWHFLSWNRKCPKEWFAETYSADFEAFMLPIPNGYDELLRLMYGNYMTPVKHWSGHEYPLYATQLRQLRAIVRQKEAEMEAQGLVPKTQKEDRIYPTDWRQMLAGKKVILYVSGLPMYSEFGERALDKLEDNLQLFRENRDKIALWWRPQSQMRTMLGLISPEAVTRYERILAEYKENSWGICDESDEIDRALEACDAYYGETGWTANTVQQKGRPVMIEQIVD